MIAALCETNLEKRADTEEIYQWLKKFHKEINELRPFQPGMPPVKDLNRYTQNFSHQNSNSGKFSGGQNPNANYSQFSHQQFFNQYADHNLQPQKSNFPQNPPSHAQHNHQTFFNGYSVGTQQQQQPPNILYPPSNPSTTNYFPSNVNPPVTNNYGINQTNSTITTGYNTTTVRNTKTTTTQQQGFSYQPSYNNTGTGMIKDESSFKPSNNPISTTSATNYSSSGPDFLKKID